MKLIEIVDKLIGQISPIGETNEDEKRFKNLCIYTELFEEMANTLIYLSEEKSSQEYSIKKAGEKADAVLKAWAEEVLFEYIGELEKKLAEAEAYIELQKDSVGLVYELKERLAQAEAKLNPKYSEDFTKTVEAIEDNLKPKGKN